MRTFAGVQSVFFPRFFRPRSPVHRVVRVLHEVGTGLVDEGVGVGMRSDAGHGGMRGAGYFGVVLARSEDTQQKANSHAAGKRNRHCVQIAKGMV